MFLAEARRIRKRERDRKERKKENLGNEREPELDWEIGKNRKKSKRNDYVGLCVGEMEIDLGYL